MIRIENDSNKALIDFGRDGILLMEIGETNILEEANRLADGKSHKRGPNLLGMIGPPKLYRYDNGSAHRITWEESLKWSRLLFIYLPPGKEHLQSIGSQLIKHEHDLKEAGIAPIVLPLYNDLCPGYRELIDENKSALNLLVGHTNSAYVHVLQHEPDENILMVLTDPDGRILKRQESKRIMVFLRSHLE